MIGLVLLAIALYTFFDDRYRYISYFLYISFMIGYGGGLGLWTDQITGIKNQDCAVAYTVIINGFYIITKQWSLPRLPFIKFYLVFLAFLIASALFSFFYYHLSPVQIVQGGRHFVLFLSLPILYKCPKKDFNRVFELLLYFAIVTGILYVPQVFIGKSLLPYEGEAEIEDTVGLYRYYNFPENFALFLCISFSYKELFKVKNTNCLKALFLLVLLCTLGRTLIIITSITLFMYIIITSDKSGQYIKQLIVLGIVAVPFSILLASRFSEGGTQEDLDTLLEGEFDEDYKSESSSTMTYRLAWAYERGFYLSERPLGEQIFGLGMCSESQDWVNNEYDFLIGLTDNDGQVAQLRTPDIAYGNMITQLGFGGSAIFLVFVISLTVFFWKRRKHSPGYAYYASSFVLVFFLGFAASTFSDPQYFAMPFLMTCLVNEEQTSKDEKKKKLKTLLLLLLKKKRREMQMTVQS